jgi:hypothetical protein
MSVYHLIIAHKYIIYNKLWQNTINNVKYSLVFVVLIWITLQLIHHASYKKNNECPPKNLSD